MAVATAEKPRVRAATEPAASSYATTCVSGPTPSAPKTSATRAADGIGWRPGPVAAESSVSRSTNRAAPATTLRVGVAAGRRQRPAHVDDAHSGVSR
ncbi:MAG: hypothetical protein U0235_21855 [Polyangiaceae bacterium]